MVGTFGRCVVVIVGDMSRTCMTEDGRRKRYKGKRHNSDFSFPAFAAALFFLANRETYDLHRSFLHRSGEIKMKEERCGGRGERKIWTGYDDRT